jgi:hypothetical protein
MGGWALRRLSASGMAVTAAALIGVALAGGAGRAQAAQHGAHPGSGAAVAGVISTVAGGVGGPARAIGVSVRPCGVALAPGGLYVGDGGHDDQGDSIRRVNQQTDRLTTPAGTGAGGPLGLGGLAAAANWQSAGGACGVAAGPNGSLLFSEFQTNQVLLVPHQTGTLYGQAVTAGHIYTVAGNGTQGFSGDGGPGTAAELDIPFGVAVDGAGNLAIADSGNNRVRVVANRTGTFYGRAMTAGHIYTVAGVGQPGRGGDGGPATKAKLKSPSFVAVSGTGNLVITNLGYSRIRVVAETTGTYYGQPMTAGDIYTVQGGTSFYYSAYTPVAVDGFGNIVTAAIETVTPNVIQVLANTSGTYYGQAMTAGNTYTVAGNGTQGFSGDGGPATSAELASPVGVAVDSEGNLIIADQGNDRVRLVAASSGTRYGQPMVAGDIYTVAGNGNYRLSGAAGPAAAAQLNLPASVAVDPAGDTLIPDTANDRVMVTAAATGTLYGRAATAGHIYDEAGTGVVGFSGDGGPGYLAEVDNPEAVAADRAGNLVIADTANQRIRMVAARTGMFFGQAMTAGDIYTIAGNGTVGFSGDGGPATSAELEYVYGVTMDAAGNLIFADVGTNRVRVVAASTATFYGKAMTVGDIYTVAGNGVQGFSGDGGPATSAALNIPYGVTVDNSGNLVIADTGSHRIRVVAVSTSMFYGKAMTAEDIYTVAGNGTGGFSGDGGPATSAELRGPQGVSVDGTGNLLIADTGNQRIRVVAARAGTFYGKPMSPGNIYTVAGNGTRGFSGDGGPAARAGLLLPGGVAADGTGLLIADTGYGNSATSRIRGVTG